MNTDVMAAAEEVDADMAGSAGGSTAGACGTRGGDLFFFFSSLKK